MPKLAAALKLWTNEGHSQLEFAAATGIDKGTVSLIFRGKRGLSIEQRAAIYHAFAQKEDLRDALGWICADLRDNIPPELERFISVHLNEPPHLKDTGPRKSRKELAKAEFIALLEQDDPAGVSLVLSLYDFLHGRQAQ